MLRRSILGARHANGNREVTTMNNTVFDQIQHFQHSWLEAARQVQEAGTRAAARAVEQQLELANVWLQAASRQASAFAESRTWKDLVEAEAQIAADVNERLAAIARANLEIFSEARDNVTRWVRETVEQPLREVVEPAREQSAASSAAA